MNEIIIGIDLGTTNSEVAVVKEGKVNVVADEDKLILPSFVGINDSGEVIVGETARNQYLVYPERTVKSIKRLMGQETQVELADQTFTPQEISAIILQQLKTIAEKHFKRFIDKAVITVPAYFSDAQRQATREAAEIAGLEVVRMINEPTAAALAYGASQSEAKQVLVYDLGGGTFDVSVVRIESGVVEVLASHGNNHLGGDDFDQQIIDYLLNHIQSKYDIDLHDDSKAMARIARSAENAKFQLSDQPYVQIDEEYLVDYQGDAVNLSVELSRAAYEEMIEPYITETMDAMHIALKGAQLATRDIDEIILVGGSTRTPCIRERLFGEFGFEPHGEVNPDLCVAMGAAIQAAMINGQQVDTVLVDVTPYTYGTSAIGMLNGEDYPFTFVPIIHKNSVLPSQKSEAFMTNYHGQEFIDVTIYQGEDYDALNNIKIGEFRIEGLQDVDAGNVVTLTLDLDLNGILHVSAQEKLTGLEKSILIKNALSESDIDALDTAKQRITSLFGKLDSSLYEQDIVEKEERSEIPEIEAARVLIAKAEKLFSGISNEDKEDIDELIDAIKVGIDANDKNLIEQPISQLNDILYYLES